MDDGNLGGILIVIPRVILIIVIHENGTRCQQAYDHTQSGERYLFHTSSRIG
jgi:hypothetical protein